MEIYPLDIAAGSVLVIGILVLALGIAIWRYRGGYGPIALAASGALSALASLTRLAGLIAGVDPSPIPLYIGYSMAVFLLLASILFWRKDR